MAAVSEPPCMMRMTSGRKSHRLPNTRRRPKPPRAASSRSIAATGADSFEAGGFFCSASRPATSFAVASSSEGVAAWPPSALVAMRALKMPFSATPTTANCPCTPSGGLSMTAPPSSSTIYGTRPRCCSSSTKCGVVSPPSSSVFDENRYTSRGGT